MKGSCLCGSVVFSSTEKSLWCAHCHCSLCQRAHGAGVVTWMGFNKQMVQVESTENTLHWYESSPGAERGFCARCGSTLFFRSEKWPGELHIVRANIAEGATRTPQAHVFVDTAVDWLQLGDSLPRKHPK